MTRDVLTKWVVDELTRVIGALFETTATTRSRTSGLEDGFAITLTASAGAGQLQVGVGRRGAESLAKGLNRPDVPLTDAAIVDTLRQIADQVVTAFDQSSEGVTLSASVAVATALPQPSAGLGVDILVKSRDLVLSVVVIGDLELASGQSAAAPPKTLDVIMDIDLPLIVRFGRTELPLRVLAGLGPGSLIDLGRAPDELVDVLISNRVVARGEVVIVAGNYGVRVHEVVSPAERARSLEAELA